MLKLTTTSPPSLLIKIQQAKYIHDMYDKEYLWFSDIERFRKAESESNDDGRMDKRELALSIKQVKELSLKLPNMDWFTPDSVNAQYWESPVDPNASVCAFYVCRFDDDYNMTNWDDRLLHKGDKALLILDMEGFLNTLHKSLEDHRITSRRNFVTYYDDNSFSGKLSPFHKRKLFTYESEYRIVTQNHPTLSFPLPLPGLKQFAMITDTDVIPTIRFSRKKDI